MINDVDVLIMPGGNDIDDDTYGGPGQRKALGEAGILTIKETVERHGILYVGICAGAFLASNKDGNNDLAIAPSVKIHDEQHFGCASVRGMVDLNILPSAYHSILSPS